MKVLFLDIDGVLSSLASQSQPKVEISWAIPEERLVEDFDPDCIARLITIVKQTGASIVISSSWRKLFEKQTLVNHFKKYGIDCIVDMTPDLKQHRGLEIQAWLNEHKDIEKFAILDDDNDMFHLAPYLIKTNWKYGLTEDNANKVIEMLGKICKQIKE